MTLTAVDKSLDSDGLTALWAEIVELIKTHVSVDSYERWFRHIEPVELDDKALTLSVPNKIFQLWIETNYDAQLRSVIVMTIGSPRETKYVFRDEGGVEPPHPPKRTIIPKTKLELVEPVEPRMPASGGGSGFNPRNNFDAFVVGPTNQFAHAACKAVSDAPARTYNPLFIYGGVGLGKTHLMHAIGQAITAKRKPGKVVYITSEAFTNEFIDAIQNNTLIKFRKRYRQADVLLIDDIQFLADKGRTQEEFFHTFNTLFDGHKQIVLSSDRPPSEIANLETRLVSRFEWGLTAELQAPDTETRVAILRKKVQGVEVKVDDDILQFLAERIRTNVRRLEGALMRVASYVSLNSGRSPGMDRIEHLLRDILNEEARRAVTIEQIQKRVAEHFDVRIADMTSKRRPANIAFPRQIAMYLARELTKTSLSEIGEAFGGRDHGTVLHAHRLVKEKMVKEERTRQVVLFLDSQLKR
ncbi:MAG TPA: chromosomal replication initiator protein DnaA [Chthoniobacter sp.]|nr:chromosomal replication initiator protein DnaA [Chthoniobacter sp.]